MADLDIKAISLFGMNYERARLEAASLNIANANVLSSKASTTYKPVVASTNALTSFNNILQTNDTVMLTENLASKSQAIFKPEHPLANKNGYIFQPSINIAEEMITLNSATRAYEANVKAFNAYREMSAKALEIGK